MNLFKKARNWLKGDSGDVEEIAEAKRLEEDKLTVRVSQWGRTSYANIPPAPDVLDPERERR